MQIMRPTLSLFALGLVALAAAQDSIDDAPQPGKGLAIRFGAWFPTRSGSETGFSYGVGYLIPSNRVWKLEPEFYGAALRFNNGASREYNNVYKLGANLLYMPTDAALYYGVGAGIGGGGGTDSSYFQLVGNMMGGYKLGHGLFAEARFSFGSKEFLNGLGVNLGYRF
ncbi:hypothetical protein BH11ARM2_BH11ARM2_34140 [soil metagenome]